MMPSVNTKKSSSEGGDGTHLEFSSAKKLLKNVRPTDTVIEVYWLTSLVFFAVAVIVLLLVGALLFRSVGSDTISEDINIGDQPRITIDGGELMEVLNMVRTREDLHQGYKETPPSFIDPS